MIEEEILNFFMVARLAFDIGFQVLCKRVKCYLEHKELSFENFIGDLKHDLFHHQKRRKDNELPSCKCVETCLTNKFILFRDQWDRLFETKKTPKCVPEGDKSKDCLCNVAVRTGLSLESLDVTLIIFILLEFCTPKGPEKKQIDKLKKFRNYVAHLPGTLDRKSFDTKWKEGEECILSLLALCETEFEAEIKQMIKVTKTVRIGDEIVKTLIDKIEQQMACENQHFEGLKMITGLVKNLMDFTTEIKGSLPRSSAISSTNSMLDSHKNTIFVSPKVALDEAEKKLKNGVVIFRGKPGSGKSTVSLELLYKVKQGKIFGDKHECIHLDDIKQWDFFVNPDDKMVVFVDDAIGKTKNDLIEHDVLFSKLWSCVNKGNIKVIMTIDEYVIRQHGTQLRKNLLFNESHEINLDSNEFKMNDEEKRELIDKYIKSLTDDSNQETERAALTEDQIQEIITYTPYFGFPLCCKYFFENEIHYKLGFRFFRQPFDELSNGLRTLATSQDESDRMQFVLLSYMMISNGTWKRDKTEEEKETLRTLMTKFGVKTDSSTNNNVIEGNLDTLKKRYGYIRSNSTNSEILVFQHETILTSVLITLKKLPDNYVEYILCHCNERVLFDLVRPATYEANDAETVIVVEEEHYKQLAKRFVKHIHYELLSHAMFDDAKFGKTFVDEQIKAKRQ